MQQDLKDTSGVKQAAEEKSVRPSMRRSGPPGRPLAVLLLTLYLLIALAPLALAYLQGIPRRSFGDELSSALAMVAFAIVPMPGPFLESGYELYDPIAVVGLFNPKVGFSPLDIVDFASDTPKRYDAPLPGSPLEDFNDLGIQC